MSDRFVKIGKICQIGLLRLEKCQIGLLRLENIQDYLILTSHFFKKKPSSPLKKIQNLPHFIYTISIYPIILSIKVCKNL